MKSDYPLVSLIIVNWNGKKWLRNCLDSVYSQNYKNFEVIFVDNASTDDSVDFVKDNYPETKIIQNEDNYGFAKGNNIATRIAKGKYLFFLNNDTKVGKNFLTELVKSNSSIEKNSQGI